MCRRSVLSPYMCVFIGRTIRWWFIISGLVITAYTLTGAYEGWRYYMALALSCSTYALGYYIQSLGTTQTETEMIDE